MYCSYRLSIERRMTSYCYFHNSTRSDFISELIALYPSDCYYLTEDKISSRRMRLRSLSCTITILYSFIPYYAAALTYQKKGCRIYLLSK